MKPEQLDFDFSSNEENSKNNESHLRVVRSVEDTQKDTIAEKFGIVKGSSIYDRMNMRDGNWYVEDETIEDYDTRMKRLYEGDEKYSQGQN